MAFNKPFPPGRRSGTRNGNNNDGSKPHVRAATISAHKKRTPSNFNNNNDSNGNNNQKTVKISYHQPSNTIAATSTTTTADIESKKQDMRDILWLNSDLLKTQQGYRKKVWKYLQKNIYLQYNGSTPFNWDMWKHKELPSNIDSNNQVITSNINRDNDNKDDNKNDDIKDDDVLAYYSSFMTKEKLNMLINRHETYIKFVNAKVNIYILMYY